MKKRGVEILIAGIIALTGMAGAEASNPNLSVPAWAWLLGAGTLVAGVILLVGPPLKASWDARAARAVAEDQARAAHRMPVAEDPVYNEGCWWLVVRPGSASSSSIECRVFDPLGRSPSRSFFEGGPTVTLR